MIMGGAEIAKLAEEVERCSKGVYSPTSSAQATACFVARTGDVIRHMRSGTAMPKRSSPKVKVPTTHSVSPNQDACCAWLASLKM